MSTILKTFNHSFQHANISTFALGLGAVAVAPLLVPVLKPVAKATIKGGVRLYEQSKAALNETGEMLEDVVAEVKAERMTAAQPLEVEVKTTEK